VSTDDIYEENIEDHVDDNGGADDEYDEFEKMMQVGV
jgi:hypothetical protein